MQVAADVQARWCAVCHSNIIALCRTFVHGGATYFAHEYWPCAQSLLQHHFTATLIQGFVTTGNSLNHVLALY